MTAVSVIIPAYNASATIGACIDSVRRQRNVNAEIIVIDDGSTDATAELVDGMPGVMLLRQENAGPASARNRGIEAASGEWLAFLDSDEAWLDENKLERQLACARSSHAVLVGTSLRYGADKALTFRRFLFGNPLTTSAVLAKRDAVLAAGCFEAGRYHSEDYLLWLRIAAAGGAAALADVRGSENIAGRRNYAQGGLSGDLAKMQRGEEENFRALFREGLLDPTAIGNAILYLTAMTWSRLKFLRRLAIRAARKARGRA